MVLEWLYLGNSIYETSYSAWNPRFLSDPDHCSCNVPPVPGVHVFCLPAHVTDYDARHRSIVLCSACAPLCAPLWISSHTSAFIQTISSFFPKCQLYYLDVDWGPPLSMSTLCFHSNTVASSSPATTHRQPLMLTVSSQSPSSSSRSPPWPYYLLSIR
jgi:hypothetical protein